MTTACVCVCVVCVWCVCVGCVCECVWVSVCGVCVCVWCVCVLSFFKTFFMQTSIVRLFRGIVLIFQNALWYFPLIL